MGSTISTQDTTTQPRNRFITEPIKCERKNPFEVQNDATRNENKYTQADAYVKNNGLRDLKKIKEAQLLAQEAYQQAVVENIILTDNHKPQNTDVSRISAKIAEAAKYTGVDAGNIACIVKKESHFKQDGLNVVTGKGPMGLTSIAIKDMYVRPQVFDNQLKALIKEYRTLSQVFLAKQNNPSLDLGNFGELLYEYKTWTNLRSAIKKDYDLNLKIGAYYYKYQLNKAKQNPKIKLEDKERIAFMNYNGSYDQTNYAQASVDTLKAARTYAKTDEKYVIALSKINTGFKTAV